MGGLTVLKILYVEISIIGIVILLAIRFYLRKREYTKDLDKRTFKWLIWSDILILIFDAITWVMDGLEFSCSEELFLVSMMIYYCLVPLPSLFWLLYTDVKLHADQQRLKRLLILYSIPCVISTILVLTTLKTGWIFTIGSDGVYYRGPYMVVIILLTYVYLGGALAMAIRERCREKNPDRIKVCRYLIFFPIPTIILSFVQVELYGVTLIWICMAVSLLIIFINVQSEQISKDTLTGLLNRGYLDSYLDRILTTSKGRPEVRAKYFAMIVDMDDFKQVNDTFGHVEGDKLLVAAANLLKQSCRLDDVVTRMGGDEFFIIGQRDNRDEVLCLRDEILDNVRLYNERSNEPYSMCMSLGFAMLDKQIKRPDQFITAADINMYRNKEKKKANN